MNYNDIRRSSREIRIGKASIGGNHPIAIQSMTNTDTLNAEATKAQIKALESAGCDIVRITVPTLEAADTVFALKESGIEIPIVADIHFDYKIAIRCAESGFDKIRINPGNIGDDEKVREVCRACTKYGIPIRIGVNSGSLEKHILAKYGRPSPEALAESAMYHTGLLWKYDFDNIVISIKASNVKDMIEANRIVAERCTYPLHLGVTESGSEGIGTLKSAIGIGSLLCDGIGDTIRVSLTADPINEITAAKNILRSLHIEGQSGMDIVSCPTCGRTQIDLISLSKRFSDAVRDEKLDNLPIKVALMGCVVNGPGEAREADIGIAGGKGQALLISHGEVLDKIPEEDIIPRLISEIRKIKGTR